MILLDPGNRILGETVQAQLIRENPEEKRDAIDVRLCDFDDVAYRVSIDKENRSLMKVSFSAPWWTSVKDQGGEDALQKHYKDLVTDSEQGFDVTLAINLDSLPGKPEELVQKIQNLKSNLLGGIFDKYLSAVLQGGKGVSSFRFKLRSDTEIFFLPGNERVTIIFSLDFKEKVDRAVAKVFLQEFVDAKRNLGAAPPVQWGTNPPLELKEFGIAEPIPGLLGFCTFPILKSHVDKDKKDKAIACLQSFRTFIQYHIKCSKSYFHSRMRLRVKELLLVLNRAKQEPLVEAQKRTITGRTFTRAV